MNISQNCRVRSTVKANGASLPVSAPVAAQLYRIAQEAVRNAMEHGAAREVLIQLTFGHRDMVLTVQDDGEGFNTKTNGHGMGLRIMRYRAQCIGGSCEVRPGPSQGHNRLLPCAAAKRSLLFLQSHECNNTNRKKIARRRSGGPSSAMRRAQAANQQSAGPRLCRGRGQHVGRQTARSKNANPI